MKVFKTLMLTAIMGLAAAAASAHEVSFAFDLSGAGEAPPNASPGAGGGLVTFDLDLVAMKVEANFTGLTAPVTAAHIHCCTAAAQTGTAGVATVVPSFPDFPLGATSGDYSHTFDMTAAESYNPSFITASGGTVSGALTALLAGLDAGKAYFNIHTSGFPGGEIRGFLQPVPLPSAFWLMLAGLAGLKSRIASRNRRLPSGAG